MLRSTIVLTLRLEEYNHLKLKGGQLNCKVKQNNWKLQDENGSLEPFLQMW